MRPTKNTSQIGTLKAGIVLCSRINSSRIPNKAITEINGEPLLIHLLKRLLPSRLPICIAVPDEDLSTYSHVLAPLMPQVILLSGMGEDPLRRMSDAAKRMELDVVVRVTHDKIFVDDKDIEKMLDIYAHSELDYLYSSSFVPGCGFEVIRASVLHQAAEKFSNVEHISYAIQALTDRKTDVSMGYANSTVRLLIDYPKDLYVIERIFERLGHSCSKDEAIGYLEKNPLLAGINRLPELTVYTCAFNAQEWIASAMESVERQYGFKDLQYILVNDASSDDTELHMLSLDRAYPNTLYVKNQQNLGLASSCNVALSNARGKYILRLDADDELSDPMILQSMIQAIEGTSFDVMYPDHYLGHTSHIEKGNVHHHAGGAIFRTRALNHLRFTDGLRGFEGHDLFERAKSQLKIGYFERPAFFYRQHEKSLTKQDPEMRAKIKKEIDERLT